MRTIDGAKSALRSVTRADAQGVKNNGTCFELTPIKQTTPGVETGRDRSGRSSKSLDQNMNFYNEAL